MVITEERRRMADLEIQPPVLNISFYAGDGVSFKIICADDEDPPGPIPITGTIEAHIRVDRSPTALVVVEFSSDMTNADDGEIMLSLTGEQSQDLIDHISTKKNKFKGVWDVEWTPTGAEPLTLVQGNVECLADVTR
jgi:hypothetical protein